MPNVLAIFSGDKRELGGCEIYRTTMPFHYLQKNHQGWVADWIFSGEMQRMRQNNKDFFSQVGAYYDLFVYPRSYFKTQEQIDHFKFLVDVLHSAGKRMVYEVDDDLTNEDREVIDADIFKTASLCDAITVTTPYLAKLMTERTGKKSYILPNMISRDLWAEPTTGEFLIKDKVVLGLTGSGTHKEDWRVLADVLPKILQDNNVHLLLVGYHPDYLSDLPNTSYLPGLPYTKYSQIIQKCDIILAPLNNDKFNLSKSPIKVIEGMSAFRTVNGEPAGAATIASNHPVYQLAINNKNGMLVEHTPEAWQSGLDKLIYDTKLRNDLQIQGHKWVIRHHDISKQSQLWANAYSAILKMNLGKAN